MFDLQIKYRNDNTAKGKNIDGYYIDFIESDSKNIVITFENANEPNKLRPERDRLPWGGDFLRAKGYNVLGIKPIEVDWYRKKSIHNFFRSEEFRNFIARFDQVIFYGSSMGGYAALTFSQSVPGSSVIAFNPQSSLDPKITPWDTRHPQGSKQDWSGDFSDARDCAKSAQKIYIAYDPFDKIDNLHVSRLHQENIVPLKFFCVGHVVAEWMRQARILEEFTTSSLNQTATSQSFFDLAKKRKTIPRYYFEMANLRNHSNISDMCLKKILFLNKEEYISPNDLSKLVRKCKNITFLKEKETIKQISKMNDELVFSISKSVSDMGQYRDALEICQSVESTRPIGYKLYFNMAESAHRAGLLPDAFFYAKKSISLNEKSSNSFRVMTRILRSSGLYSEAIRYSIMGLKLEKNSFLGWLDLGEIYQECGKDKDALFCFTKALKLSPDDKNVQNKIGNILDNDLSYFIS